MAGQTRECESCHQSFFKKTDAVSYAHDIAKNQHSELIIHDRHGKIMDKDSFGNDPHPPIDKIH